MLSRDRVFTWTAVFIVCLTRVCLADMDRSVRDLLTKSLASQERLNVQISRSEITSDAMKGGKQYLAAQTVEMRRDDSRYDQIQWSWNSVPSLSAPRRFEDATAMRQVFDGSQLFDSWLFRGTDIYDLLHKEVILVRDLPLQKASRNTTLAQYPAAPLDGYAVLTPWPQNGRTVQTVLGMSTVSVRPKTESIDGSACHVIDASERFQKITLWIDPSHGYHVAQAEYQEAGGQNGLTSSLRDVRFKKIDDVWVPMQGTVRQRWSRNGKLISEGTMQIKRLSIDLKPDFAAVGAFVTDLPNGTRVKVYDMQGVRFVWQNGRIVPDIDNSAIAAIDKTVGELPAGGVADASVLSASVTPTVASANRATATVGAVQAVQGTRRWVWWMLAVGAVLVLMATQWWKQRHATGHLSFIAERSAI